MMHKICFIGMVNILLLTNVFAQQAPIEKIKKDMPPYLSVLLEWGQRPEWSRDGKYIYFLPRDYSDVFRINVETREIEPITTHYFHESYNRVFCLYNGDLLLEGPEKYDSSNPWETRHKLSLFVLKAPFDKPAIPLNRNIDEGPAISRTDNRIAWTLPTQRKIKMAELEYDEHGNPVLKNERIILDFDALGLPMSQRLETQDFYPHSNKLVFTYYRGTLEEPFYFADPYLLDLETGKIEPIIDNPTGYDEAEGISPDGKFMMIESDRDHEPKHWELDIYKLALDGSGNAERLLDWSDKFPGCHSDNPVVSPDAKRLAFQFGFNTSQPGQGNGIFLFDLDAYEDYKQGGSSQKSESIPLSSDTFYQYSIWWAFVNKIFDGDLTVEELYKNGDIGLGSFDFLDGELVMLEGVAYRIRENGEVSIASENDPIVYANATFFEPDIAFELDANSINEKSLQELILKKFNTPNTFKAIKIKGEFTSIKLGGLHKQEKPFEVGLDILIPNRPVFTAANISGTLIGFYCPEFIGNINVKGFHFHFISDDQKYGGHVMEFKTESRLLVEMDEMNRYEFQLPNTPEFKKVGFDKSFQYNK